MIESTLYKPDKDKTKTAFPFVRIPSHKIIRVYSDTDLYRS